MSFGEIHNLSLTNRPLGSYFLGVFLASLILTTILGNILVIIAVILYRNLRNMTNFFIVSLACADLLVGCVVMPFAAYSEMTFGFWPFGYIWCDLWHAFDVLSSTASILNLCMIAVERFWATENPITYGSRMSKKRCLIMIGIVWFCSSFISFPAIVWWHAMSSVNKNNTDAYSCVFPNEKTYIILSSIISFYIPLIIMIVVYVRIYKTATTVMKTLTAGSKVVYKNNKSGEVLRLGIHRGGMINSRHDKSTETSLISQNKGSNEEIKSKSFLCLQFSLKQEINIPQGCNVSLNRRFSPVHLISSSDPSSLSSPSFKVCTQNTTSCSNINSISKPGRKKKYRKTISITLSKKFAKFATEQKAAKTLGIVMGIFIICWLPFFICNILSSIYERAFGDSKPIVMTIVSWLGYLNSAINPMIYAHSMRDFRRAFISILCGLCPFKNYTGGIHNTYITKSIITPSSSIMGRKRPIGVQL